MTSTVKFLFFEWIHTKEEVRFLCAGSGDKLHEKVTENIKIIRNNVIAMNSCKLFQHTNNFQYKDVGSIRRAPHTNTHYSNLLTIFSTSV